MTKEELYELFKSHSEEIFGGLRYGDIKQALAIIYNKAIEDVEDGIHLADQGFGPLDLESLKIK